MTILLVSGHQQTLWYLCLFPDIPSPGIPAPGIPAPATAADPPIWMQPQAATEGLGMQAQNETGAFRNF